MSTLLDVILTNSLRKYLQVEYSALMSVTKVQLPVSETANYLRPSPIIILEEVF